MRHSPLGSSRSLLSVLGSVSARANWWDPNGVGLSVRAAWRAINSVGTPWGSGPVNYAQSLVNQANPGVNDLVEGNGAVPWVQATGWGFAAALLQYFDTGLIPANDQSWSAFVQFANVTTFANTTLVGCFIGALRAFRFRPTQGALRVSYDNGGGALVPPVLVTGNLGIVGNRGYRNGIVEGAPMIGWGGPSIFSLYIGALNQVGVANQFITSDIESVVLYDGGPAAVQAQALAIATAMAAL